MKTLILIVALWAGAVSAHDTKPSVEAETSLKWLMNGNTRYTAVKSVRRDGQKTADVKRLSTGQNPHAIILSCSDSRVPPEIVLDQKLGEVFVVRTAGEALDNNAIGSIEYAVDHLGSKLIVVMGHTSCGAVKAAHGTLDGTSAGTPALDGLVKDIHPRIAKFKGKTPSADWKDESWANTEGVAKDLVTRSKLLAQRWEKGELWIVPSLYDLNTGKVTFHENMKTEGGQRTLSNTPKSASSKKEPAHAQ